MNDHDRRLLERLRADDPDAFREFIDAYRDRILTLVARVAGHGADAEDLAQEAFLKAFRSLHRFGERSSLYTWLYRIAANTAMDFRKRRRVFAPLPLERDDDHPGPGEPHDEGPAPVDSAVLRERVEALRAAVEALPEPFRTTLVLRDMESRTYEEVARIQGVSIGTVESRIFRARQKLRALLGEVEP